jgi:hypothetical protein
MEGEESHWLSHHSHNRNPLLKGFFSFWGGLVVVQAAVKKKKDSAAAEGVLTSVEGREQGQANVAAQ